MKKNPQSDPFKSPGFANAFFAVKDMQADYQMFNGSPIVPAKVTPVQPKKPSAPINPHKNPATVAKPLPAKPVKTIQQKVESTLPKQQFKMTPGKQFQNSIKFSLLNLFPCTNGVYELTQNKVKSDWQYNLFCQGVPSDQIVQKPEVSFSFNAEDIRQGQLGNCYFVTALASIAHCPQVFKARIPKFKQYGSNAKNFEVNLFESGKCISIMVDNLFPNVYCKPVLNDISPMILQKAYAQSYGNFQVINIGHSSDALRDLTGASTFYLDFKNKEELRHRIKSAFTNGYAVVIASKAQHQHPSLSPKHSYNVLGCEAIGGEVFLRLRDPRGWTKACFAVPELLVNNPENGIFWIDEKNLEQSFEVITICKVMKNCEYFFKTFSGKELTNNRGGLLMNFQSPTKVFVSIHQKHKKFFDQKFSYDIIKLLIAEVEIQKDSFEVKRTLKTDFNAQQVCTMELQLTPGRYILLGQIGRKKGKELYPKQFFTLSVYTDKKDIDFEVFSGNIDLRPFLINYIRENKEEFQQTSTEQGLYRCRGALFGYVCMYYQNRGKKNAVETIEYTVVKNVDIGEKRVQLAPNASKLLLHAIGAEKNCSYQCSTSTKTAYS